MVWIGAREGGGWWVIMGRGKGKGSEGGLDCLHLAYEIAVAKLRELGIHTLRIYGEDPMLLFPRRD